LHVFLHLRSGGVILGAIFGVIASSQVSEGEDVTTQSVKREDNGSQYIGPPFHISAPLHVIPHQMPVIIPRWQSYL